MRIKTGQKMYRIRGPDGMWIQKGPGRLQWTASEDAATFWKKIGHLKSAQKEGVLQEKRLNRFLEGLPMASLEVVEYVVTLERTGRKSRLTEINNFYKPDPDEKQDISSSEQS